MVLSFLFVFLCLTNVSATDINSTDISDSYIEVNSLELNSWDINLLNTNSKINVMLNSSDVIGYYNFYNSLEVNVSDVNGDIVNYGNLTFHDVFGKDYTVDVKNGVAKLDHICMSKTGNFIIYCDYLSNDIYNGANCSLNLYVPVLNATNHNIRGSRYGNIVYFSGNIVDTKDEEEVIEGYLKFYREGIYLGDSAIDYNGNFVFMWNISDNLIGKNVSISADYYDGLGNYNPCKNIINKSFLFNENLNTEVFFDIKKNIDGSYFVNGTVLDELGNPVIGGAVNVEIDGKSYNVPVDTYGTFCFNINNNFERVNYEINVYDWGSKANLTDNVPLMNMIEHTPLTDYILSLAKKGNPIIKFGNGNGPVIVMDAGLHGAELPSIVAIFRLINTLANSNQEINGTLYISPLLFPEAIANNTRIYNGINLNTVANIEGSLSNQIANFAFSVNADGFGDFHGTRHSDSDVGVTCAMGSLKPTYESYLIAAHIANRTGYSLDVYPEAGVDYPGALEDYCNVRGIPAVTCEVLSNHKNVEYGSIEVAYNEMLAFLSYFGIDVKEMYTIPMPSNMGSYDLTISYLGAYNYNPSSKTLKNAINVNETSSENIHGDGSINLLNTGNSLLILLISLFTLVFVRFKR